MYKKIAVFASGGGTDFQSVVDANEKSKFCSIAYLVASKPNIGAIERAKKHGIQTLVYDKESGVAYYINNIEELKKLDVTAHGANEKIGSFNRIEEFKIIFSASEYEEGLYRGSIRSKEKSVVEIATKYGGGGHKLACGVRGLTLQQVMALIDELKKL